MQGSISDRRIGSRVVGGVIALIVAVTAVSVYTFYRVDRVEENVGAVNQFYVPALKRLNLLNGKWVAYQRSFEQSVSFRKWGASNLAREEELEPRLRLRKMVEGDLAELERLASGGKWPESEALRSWAARLSELADREPAMVAELESDLKNKRYREAAASYTEARQLHLSLSQDLAQLGRAIETRLAELQLSTETELRRSQNTMLLLLGASLLFSLVVLFRLRRWLNPIVEWTRVAQEIALKGITRDVRFPRISRGMPPEISLLTREFTRMGTTVLERERTIHQQKQKLESLNEHLKEQNSRLSKLGGLNERILNGMSSALLVVNAQGVVEQFNERYCRVFGVNRTQILGKPATEVLGAWPGALVARWLSASESLHQARSILEGRVFDVRVHGLSDHVGRLLLFEDVTELVQAEERLEHARKLVLAGNLSSQVAHEVRNPLNSMSLQLEMLEEDVASEQARSRVQAIAEQVERLDRITRRYLDVGRTVSRRRERVGLHALVETCVAFLSKEIQVSGARLVLELGAADDSVGGDADAISQVLFNLVRNALEALREHPGPRVLTIATSCVASGGFTDAAASLKVRVQDSGPGIPASVRPRVFEPFVTTKAVGHGLGLSVSRQICIEHGGELKLVETEAGAAFEFSLPRLELPLTREHAPDLGC